MSDVTQILLHLEQGSPAAAEELFAVVYDELRRLAAKKLSQERPGQTLNATGLVHEAYLRLFKVNGDGQSELQHWDSRGHFFAAAAEAMRRILIDNARRKQRLRHGGGRQRVDLLEHELASEESDDDLIELDEALQKLEREDPEAAQVIKLRSFTGLSIEQVAEMLGCWRHGVPAMEVRAGMAALCDRWKDQFRGK